MSISSEVLQITIFCAQEIVICRTSHQTHAVSIFNVVDNRRYIQSFDDSCQSCGKNVSKTRGGGNFNRRVTGVCHLMSESAP